MRAAPYSQEDLGDAPWPVPPEHVALERQDNVAGARGVMIGTAVSVAIWLALIGALRLVAWAVLS